jgi:hypothetical protein
VGAQSIASPSISSAALDDCGTSEGRPKTGFVIIGFEERVRAASMSDSATVTGAGVLWRLTGVMEDGNDR